MSVSPLTVFSGKRLHMPLEKEFKMCKVNGIFLQAQGAFRLSVKTVSFSHIGENISPIGENIASPMDFSVGEQITAIGETCQGDTDVRVCLAKNRRHQ